MYLLQSVDAPADELAFATPAPLVDWFSRAFNIEDSAPEEALRDCRPANSHAWPKSPRPHFDMYSRLRHIVGFQAREYDGSAACDLLWAALINCDR